MTAAAASSVASGVRQSYDRTVFPTAMPSLPSLARAQWATRRRQESASGSVRREEGSSSEGASEAAVGSVVCCCICSLLPLSCPAAANHTLPIHGHVRCSGGNAAECSSSSSSRQSHSDARRHWRCSCGSGAVSMQLPASRHFTHRARISRRTGAGTSARRDQHPPRECRGRRGRTRSWSITQHGIQAHG